MKNLILTLFVIPFGFLLWACCPSSSNDLASELPTDAYYVDSYTGNDSNDGRSSDSAWKTLARASQESYGAGQALLLTKGRTYTGKLNLKVTGSQGEPFVVAAYNSDIGVDTLPVIDAAGYLAAVQIENGSHVIIRDLELTGDAGTVVEEAGKNRRYGVLVSADQPGIYPNIQLMNLNIHDIFATVDSENDGQKSTSNLGYGIGIFMRNESAKIKDVVIKGCSITRTGHTGIRVSGTGSESKKDGSVYLENVTIENNYLRQIGGPGMVPARCANVVVRNNVTDDTGSDVDPRMHNRGSGIWPWTCNDVLIEKNTFKDAFGKHDSHGAHIDFNCNNVVVQKNLSINNHGGFVEILGNNDNCSYRYNISINDGWRVKGVQGALSEGNALWTSGYTGSGNPKIGPRNSYIYNNTVFIKKDQRTCFSIISNTDGIFIANNIFYILGKTEDNSDRVNDPATGKPTNPQRVVFENNVYASLDVLPAELTIQDRNPIIGNPGFRNPGGLNPEDYIPTNVELIKDKGIVPVKLPDDPVGLSIGLEVETDFFGNPIKGAPDIGAIEL